MATTTTTKRIKVALSDEAPVSINPEEWPIVAEASRWSGGGAECQANETLWLKVREHADGRRIIYGRRDSGPGGMPIGYRGAHAGFVLAADEQDRTARTVRRVDGVIGGELADECIAALPARDL